MEKLLASLIKNMKVLDDGSFHWGRICIISIKRVRKHWTLIIGVDETLLQ